MKRLKLTYVRPEIDFVYAEPNEFMHASTIGDTTGTNKDDYEDGDSKAFDFRVGDDEDFNPFFLE